MLDFWEKTVVPLLSDIGRPEALSSRSSIKCVDTAPQYS